MKLGDTFSRFAFLLLAACLGLFLLFVPNWLISNYNLAQNLGPVWGYLYLGVVGIGAALLIGSAVWTVWKLWGASLWKARRSARRNLSPRQLSRTQQGAEIDENLQEIQQLGQRVSQPELDSRLQSLIQDFESKREAQTLEIVAFGTISSGKSSVLNLLAGQDVFATDVRGGTTVTRNEIAWPHSDKVILVDTPGLGEIDGSAHVSIAAEAAKDADLVLLVVDGPLRQSEFNLIQQLGSMEKRIIVCLNKSDWYSAEDRQKLIGQIAAQTRGFIDADDIVSIQAQAGQRVRKKVLADGTVLEENVKIGAAIDALAERMTAIVRSDGKDLMMANLLLQSRGLVEKARQQVKAALDKKAWSVVDRYMWGAGGVAAMSPFPVVDLLAGSAISTKMILDLADVYQQRVDWQTASKWLGEMGKNLVGVLGAQGATVAASAILASMIKSVPFAGTIAGGVLQGAVQALITKWIGAVFIEYFRNEMQMPEGGLTALARRQWEKVTTADEMRKLLSSAKQKLGKP
jgi:uncharacterized protein